MDNKKNSSNIYKIVFTGLMAAIVYVVTFFRFPLLGSKVHFANAMCLLSGLLLGPTAGGLAAGMGSAIYDAFGGYDVLNIAVTFVSKYAMAWICAKIAGAPKKPDGTKLVAASVIGALSYVALYELKTFVFNKFLYGYAMSAVWATMMAKLPASLINAGAAMVAAPIFYKAIEPALRKAGVMKSVE